MASRLRRPNQADPPDKYNPRLEPFRSLIDLALLKLNAVGFGLGELEKRASSLSFDIATVFDRLQSKNQTVRDLPADQRASLVDLFLRRNDAMWFFLYGDPAARVRVAG